MGWARHAIQTAHARAIRITVSAALRRTKRPAFLNAIAKRNATSTGPGLRLRTDVVPRAIPISNARAVPWPTAGPICAGPMRTALETQNPYALDQASVQGTKALCVIPPTLQCLDPTTTVQSVARLRGKYFAALILVYSQRCSELNWSLLSIFAFPYQFLTSKLSSFPYQNSSYSGCIKGTIGVVATSSCSSTCGNSCLGMQGTSNEITKIMATTIWF